MNEYAQPDLDPDPLEEVQSKPRTGQKGGRPPGTNAGGRPEIEIRVGEMQRAVDEAQAALIAAQAGEPVEKKIFRRGDRIVSLAIDKAPDHAGQIVETQVIVDIGEHTLAERLAVAATFQRWDGRKKGLKQVDPP